MGKPKSVNQAGDKKVLNGYTHWGIAVSHHCVRTIADIVIAYKFHMVVEIFELYAD